MRTFLDRIVTRQPGYPVEVAIGTGESGQVVGLHYRRDQGVVAEESGLAAQPRCRRDQGHPDRQDLDAALQDSINSVVESHELLHLGRMLSEPPCDPRTWASRRLPIASTVMIRWVISVRTCVGRQAR